MQVCTSLLSSGLYQAQEEKESLPLPLFPFSLPISSSSLPPSIPFSFSSHYLWYPGAFLDHAGLFTKDSTPIRKQARTLHIAGHPRAQLCLHVHHSLALKWLDMQTQVTPELLSSLLGIRGEPLSHPLLNARQQLGAPSMGPFPGSLSQDTVAGAVLLFHSKHRRTEG